MRANYATMGATWFAASPSGDSYRPAPGRLQRDGLAVTGGVSVPEITTAFLAVVTAIGLAIRWMVNWLSGRNDKRIAELEKKVAALTATTFRLAEALVEAIGEMPVESEARKAARKALRAAFPLSATPDYLNELAERLDELS